MSNEKDAACIARKLVRNERILNINAFDDDEKLVYGLPVYYIYPDNFSKLEPTGSPIFILPTDSCIYKNITANGLVSLAIYGSDMDDLVAVPKICIFGKITHVEQCKALEEAFCKVHPKIKHLLPGNSSGIKTQYVQLNIDRIGFMQTDKDYRGFISADLYNNAEECNEQPISIMAQLL